LANKSLLYRFQPGRINALWEHDRPALRNSYRCHRIARQRRLLNHRGSLQSAMHEWRKALGYCTRGLARCYSSLGRTNSLVT